MTKEREYLEAELGDSSKIEEFKDWICGKFFFDGEHYREQIEFEQEYYSKKKIKIEDLEGYWFEEVYICDGVVAPLDFYSLKNVLEYYKKDETPEYTHRAVFY
tara:strand:- start:21 stop:329 length:309 start_codon:yes stop_codon:yes gene_type:complete